MQGPIPGSMRGRGAFDENRDEFNIGWTLRHQRRERRCKPGNQPNSAAGLRELRKHSVGWLAHGDRRDVFSNSIDARSKGRARKQYCLGLIKHRVATECAEAGSELRIDMTLRGEISGEPIVQDGATGCLRPQVSKCLLDRIERRAHCVDQSDSHSGADTTTANGSIKETIGHRIRDLSCSRLLTIYMIL